MALFIALLFAAIAGAEEQPKITEETPYVPSPEIVVRTMLKMAGVRGNDFLIDLGSGDGRIVIDAAKKYGVRGFGVDYDPRLVRLARENARKAGVADRIDFFEQDIFKTDLSPATVVTMYLLPEYNLALRHRLLELKPGTRVVSHDWHMGDWPPDDEKTIPVPEKKVGVNKSSTIYFWIIPARIDGHWRSRVPTPKGIADLELIVHQTYQHFDGVARLAGQELPLQRPYLRASYVSFRVGEGAGQLRFQGHVSNGRIVGQVLGARDKGTRWRALKEDQAS